MIQIRNALISDMQGILEIVNHEILNGTAYWMIKLRSYEEQIKWFQHHEEAGFPIYVAIDEKQDVLGFATYDQFRPYDGYKYTVEHSVYVKPSAQGKGIGKRLMERLLTYAEHHNVHAMVAGITATNHASVRLHEWFGFKKAGILPQTGIKFNQWLDLLFMYKIMQSDHTNQ